MGFATWLGAISPADDREFFRVLAKRGVIYTVESELGSAVAVNLSIANPDSTIEASNGGLGSTLEWVAPQDGNYFVAVSAPSHRASEIDTGRIVRRAAVTVDQRIIGNDPQSIRADTVPNLGRCR